MARQRVRRSAVASRKPRCAGASPRNLRARLARCQLIRVPERPAGGPGSAAALGAADADLPEAAAVGRAARALRGRRAEDDPAARSCRAAAATQLAAPPSRLRQQTLPVAQALPSRQPMLAPPGQVALASMHGPSRCWMQQAWAPGMQVVWPHGIGRGGLAARARGAGGAAAADAAVPGRLPPAPPPRPRRCRRCRCVPPRRRARVPPPAPAIPPAPGRPARGALVPPRPAAGGAGGAAAPVRRRCPWCRRRPGRPCGRPRRRAPVVPPRPAPPPAAPPLAGRNRPCRPVTAAAAVGRRRPAAAVQLGPASHRGGAAAGERGRV